MSGGASLAKERMNRSTADLIHELRDVLERQSISYGNFTLVSGAQSNYYCDTKLTVLSPLGASLIGEVLYRVCRVYDVEAIGGLELGAPLMAVAATIAAQREGQSLYSFNVRKTQKAHGKKQKVDESWHPDGKLLVSNRRVVLVDDVITSGGSIQEAIDEVKGIGCDIRAVIGLVDRQAGGSEKLLAQGLNYFALFHTDTDGKLHVNELPRRIADAIGSVSTAS
jgi:orotate phosphoribosyltransferase